MVELHVKRNLDNKNIIGVKFATWRLFQPMGITWWDGVVDKIESGTEYYDGYLRETGIGITYQRMLWKGLFASVEVLPQIQTYTDLDGNKIKNGLLNFTTRFIWATMLHLVRKNDFFIEPQVHSTSGCLITILLKGLRSLTINMETSFFLSQRFT
jgi:hypothetical protein